MNDGEHKTIIILLLPQFLSVSLLSFSLFSFFFFFFNDVNVAFLVKGFDTSFFILVLTKERTNERNEMIVLFISPVP